jgi:hypothetical protein
VEILLIVAVIIGGIWFFQARASGDLGRMVLGEG